MRVSRKLLESGCQNGVVHLVSDGPQLQLFFLEDGLLRVRLTWGQVFAPERSYTLVKTGWDDQLDDFMADERQRVALVTPRRHETEAVVILQTELLAVHVNKEPFGIAIYDNNGVLLHTDVLGKAYRQDELGRVYHYSCWKEGDGFYGFGEKTGLLNKARRRLRMSNQDAIGYDPRDSDPLYKHIPFYLVLNKNNQIAYGMFYHNSYESVFDMGAERSGYWPPYTYFMAEGGELDWFFCYGPSVGQVVERYTDLTGKTALPPRYTLGYMGSSMYYTELDQHCDDAIVDFLKQAGEQGIPCEGFFLSSGYTAGTDGKRHVFEWNDKRFPQPARFVERLRQAGAELCPNVKPGMLLTHPRYRQFASAGAYIMNHDNTQPQQDMFWGGYASFVDFTSPAGRRLWQDALKEALLEHGVRTVWNDNCEYEIEDLTALCHGDGQVQPLAGLRPVMGNLMAKAARQAMQEHCPGIRPYILNRAGFAGLQRYAASWCGDNMTSWESLQYNIPTMLGMGLSGFANQGSDIGGFAGPRPDPELLVRWVQQGIFQPRFCIHSCNNDNTVTEPWMYPDYTGYIRQALQLRYTLAPYLYSLLYQASDSGAPFMRPLFYEFQQDTAVYDESFDYLCGPFLLVANVIQQGARQRSVYLPKGARWRTWGDWKLYDGGTQLTVDAPLDAIPLFVRSGSIIPMSSSLTSLHAQAVSCIDYLIEPSQDGSFTLYEDDGCSEGYREGAYLLTHISCRSGDETVIVLARQGHYQSRVATERLLIICPEKAPLEVWINAIQLPRVMARAIVDKDGLNGWYYNAQAGTVSVALPQGQCDSTIRLLFVSKDLISM